MAIDNIQKEGKTSGLEAQFLKASFPTLVLLMRHIFEQNVKPKEPNELRCKEGRTVTAHISCYNLEGSNFSPRLIIPRSTEIQLLHKNNGH